MAKNITATISFRDQAVSLHFKRITMAEEVALRAEALQLAELPEGERVQASVEFGIKTLCGWASSPVSVKKAKGKEEPLYEGLSASASIQKLFDELKEDDADLERLVDHIIFGYRERLQPSVLFQ